MPTALLAPLFTDPAHVVATLQQQGHAVLSPEAVAQLSGCELLQLHGLQDSWNDLPPDAHLKDGGRYRKRRHACFVAQGSALQAVPHRAHWQPIEYNALHGGMERWFEPMLAAATALPAWQQLLLALAGLFDAVTGAPQPWFIEAHQFRIDTEGGIGRPTPEGAHRDGVDFVAVFLIDRHQVKGGETRVFEADGPQGQRFTLTAPWSLLLLDDARVIHESTPIQPLAADGGGHRDTLVLTYRRGGFQGG